MQRISSLLLTLALAVPVISAAHAQSAAVQQLYQQAHTEQQAGNLEKAIATYRELLRQDPSIAPAYNNLGRLYFSLGRFGEAAEVLEKGIKLKPDMAPAQIMLGASYLQLSQPNRAVASLQAGVQAMPEDTFARQTLAQALLETHHTLEAATQLQKLVELDPKNQRGWYMLGKVQLQLSQEDFAHMRALDENSPLSHQLSGEIMESMSNTPGAIAEYKQALAADPDSSEALMHLAGLYWSTGDWSKAETAFQQYLKRKPGDCQAEWRLANSISEAGEDNAQAFAAADAAVKSCPDLPQARVERARALLKQNKPREALPDLRLAEAKTPDEPSTQFLLARAYHALGDEAQSKAAMARFQQLDKAEHAAQEKHAAAVIGANQ